MREYALRSNKALPTGILTGGKAFWQFAKTKPLGAISAVIIVSLVLVALLAPWVAPYDPTKGVSAEFLPNPSRAFPMGGDEMGRDVLSRVIYGARVSLWVGIISVGIGVLGGAVLGLISGYFEKMPDAIIQRVMDALMALPPLVVALVVVAILGPGLNNTMLAIAASMIPGASRVVRGAVLSVKQSDFIDAARAAGCTGARVLGRHILPNVAAPIIILASIQLSGAILAEASLSFLGLGTQPPTPSWGAMLSGRGRDYFEIAPWLAIYPGLAITITVWAFNMLGDALRDVWDPRLRA